MPHQSPLCRRIFSITPACSITAMTRIRFWQCGHCSGSVCHTFRITSRHFLDGSFAGGGGKADRISNIGRSASVRCNPQAAWLREFFRQQRRKEAQVAQKRNEMMPALSPVNTLEHMAEHTTFANFLCENTQNTWNTYFCEKTGERLQYRRPRGASPGIIYENTCSMCSMCSCPPTNDRE